MNASRLNDLLLNLYACPAEQQRWPEVLDRVCAELHARSAVIQILVRGQDRARSICTLRDSSSESARAEHERYMGDDVNPRLAVRWPRWPSEQYALRDRDFFSAHDPVLAELRERLAAIHLGSFMSVGAALPGGERLALVVHRDVADSRDFDADEESFARSLAPHLQQVFRIDGQLRTAQAYIQELETGIDSVRCGLVLCEADGRVRWTNGAARNLLANHPLLSTCGERLTAASTTSTTTLRRMIAEVAHDERNEGMRPDRLMVFRGEATAEPLHIVFQKVDHPHDNGAGAASPAPLRVLVMLSSPGVAPALPASLIGALFVLSPAESRLTAALCRGQTVEQYAQTAGVTIGTARFQLNQVLAKVQVKRQSELIRKVYSSVIAQALLRSH